MAEHEAARTLVKSPPELWEVCSDAESLGRHLRPFGEIRITRLEPETTVAWEGERASGTVTIEPSGWGTKVTLTALAAAEPPPEPVAGPEPEPEPEPVAEPAALAIRVEQRPALVPVHQRSGGLLGRLLGMFRPVAAPAPLPVASEPRPVPEPQPEPRIPEPAASKPPADDGIDAPAVLDAALDSLGQAHHRPFSRG